MKELGVAATIFALGVVYLVMMLAGARLLSSPPADWQPPNLKPEGALRSSIASHSLSRDEALATPQFYLLWGILFINVTAGIGILAQASPMMQDMFGRSAAQAAAIVSIISLFNASGRFVWASLSDFIGRRNTYAVFFAAQLLLFVSIPRLAATGDWVLFQLSLYAVFTMYGGGFATIPAFLADIFGARNVGAIHGAVLTAWSAAAVVGPVIITALSARARATLAPDAARVHIYDAPLQVLAVLLLVGLILTLLVRPLRPRREPQTAAQPVVLS
jgi:MFS family permease